VDQTLASLTRFDDLAQGYEAWFATPLGAFVDRAEKELILGLFRPLPGESLVEVGSGTSYFLRAVALSGARCVGLEPSMQMLRIARARPLANVDHVRGRAEALPFKDAAFDGLLCMTTLEFVQDVDLALREAARVVRPGGRLVFGVLNADGPWARARRREGGLWAEARLFSTAELRALLSPFGTVRIDYCVHVPPRLGRMPALLLRLVDRLLGCLAPASGALIGAHVGLRRQL
jgi:ubiquinone/menaquinone biosynthesis C-methylase UbiE